MENPKKLNSIEEIEELDRTGLYTINSAVAFFDMEGFTQVIYQCDDENKMKDPSEENKMVPFCGLMTEFWRKMEDHGLDKSIKIINNAGDGFLALSGDPKSPKTNASVFSAILKEEFESSFGIFPSKIHYRFKPRIKIGLHFGKIYIIHRKKSLSDFKNIYIGNALNVAARIASTNQARDYQIVCSEQFHNKLNSKEKKNYERAGTYYDLNKYPEPIVIYGYKINTKKNEQMRAK